MKNQQTGITWQFFLPVLLFMLHSGCRKENSIDDVIVVQHQIKSYADELAYLHRIDLLPQYRDDTRVAQISSYDTTGGNNDGFSGLYSYMRKEGNQKVIAELEGPGVIERIWTPTPSEDTIRFYFDGETDPRISFRFIDLFRGDHYPFIKPIVGNEVGGYYSYLPIPYQRSCKIVYSGDDLYFHQIQYRKLNETANPGSFRTEIDSQAETALKKAVQLWEGGYPALSEEIDSFYETETISSTIRISPGETVDVADIRKGGRIVKFIIDTKNIPGNLLKNLILRVHWDEEGVPAVLCPVADFFGYAFGKPSARSLLLGSESGKNYCYFPMPFDESARIEIAYEDGQGPDLEISSTIVFAPVKRNPGSEGKFYTCWKRIINPASGKPYVFQETQGRGHHAGTILQARGLVPGMTQFFEGDDSTIVDHQLRLHGTGSEDYFNGGWYALPNRWDRAFSLPIHGCLEYSIPLSRTGGYRFYLTDKISFGQYILHTIEHGPEGNRYPVDYTSVAFYYCDRPPAEAMTPESKLRKIYYPDTLILTTDLMKVTHGLFNGGSRIDWGKFRVNGEGKSIMVIHPDEIPRGDYGFYLSFIKNPGGCDFSIWQRQQRVSGVISSSAAKEETVEKLYLGDIHLNDNYPSITIMKESAQKETSLLFTEMMFVRK